MSAPVTVRDLVARLSCFDPEAPVFVRGYEGGYFDANSVESVSVERDVSDADTWWRGPHDDAEYHDEGGERQTGVYISGVHEVAS